MTAPGARLLGNIRVVLVDTSHPGNIGAAARAMKTMGLTELHLVNPRAFPDAEATALASGADDMLARAPVWSRLDQALADCTWVAGASARTRSIQWPQFEPRECAARLVAGAGNGPVALVFGRERTGLTNDELDQCHALVTIPADPAYPSLNLAAAVQVMAYELRLAGGGAPTVPPRTPEHPPATAGEMAGFYGHLEQVLTELDFLDPDNPRHLMRRLRRLFDRAGPDRNEVNILRGVLSAVQNRRRGGE